MVIWNSQTKHQYSVNASLCTVFTPILKDEQMTVAAVRCSVGLPSVHIQTQRTCLYHSLFPWFLLRDDKRWNPIRTVLVSPGGLKEVGKKTLVILTDSSDDVWLIYGKQAFSIKDSQVQSNLLYIHVCHALSLLHTYTYKQAARLQKADWQT